MERLTDSYECACKIERQRLLSGKLDLETDGDPRTANDEPAMPMKSLPQEHFLFVGSLM